MILSVCAICVVASIVSNIIKQYKPEYAMLVSICAGCAVLLLICTQLTPILSSVEEIFNNSNISSDYIKVMLKAAGVCYISYFASSICKDTGQPTAADNIELCAKISIVMLMLPILNDIIELIESLGFAN